VIPGHGELLDTERIRSDRQKLVTMNQRMAELARKGVQVFKGGLKGYYEEMKAQPSR
jgi:hypothetical protein